MKCPRCSQNVDANPKPKFYDELYDDLWDQTPKEVWLSYIQNGYTTQQAILEERSQA